MPPAHSWPTKPMAPDSGKVAPILIVVSLKPCPLERTGPLVAAGPPAPGTAAPDPAPPEGAPPAVPPDDAAGAAADPDPPGAAADPDPPPEAVPAPYRAIGPEVTV